MLCPDRVTFFHMYPPLSRSIFSAFLIFSQQDLSEVLMVILGYLKILHVCDSLRK